jgi:hypothetical protein
MNIPHRPPAPWPDPDFQKNRDQIPADEVAKYFGQRVAWSWDGTRIVAGGADLDELCDKLDAMGIPTGTVVFGYVPDPNVDNF